MCQHTSYFKIRYWSQFCHHKHVKLPYGAMSAQYSYGTVPQQHHTATVWCHVGTIQWLYSEDVGSICANQQRIMYGKGPHRTVAVPRTCGTVLRLYADTDDCNRPTRPVEADSIVVKTLRTVLCSFHDGVPLK